MARDGYLFGYVVFYFSSQFHSFSQYCQDMAYDVKVRGIDNLIYFYNSQEFYEIICLMSNHYMDTDAYIITEINAYSA